MQDKKNAWLNQRHFARTSYSFFSFFYFNLNLVWTHHFFICTCLCSICGKNLCFFVFHILLLKKRKHSVNPLLAQSFFNFLFGVGCRNRNRDRKAKHNLKAGFYRWWKWHGIWRGKNRSRFRYRRQPRLKKTN